MNIPAPGSDILISYTDSDLDSLGRLSVKISEQIFLTKYKIWIEEYFLQIYVDDYSKNNFLYQNGVE